jgi:hypothetical protein
MLYLGTMAIEADERVEMANCPSCGSTVCIGWQRLSPSARWRAVAPPRE